jgi:cytochrome c biogenesis protein CcmG, thiol:disulfide interchange protein DsbE
MKRLLFVLPLVLFAALAAYFVVALRPGADPSVLPSALIGKLAPGFDLPTLDGTGRVTSSGLRGKVTVVNFFASWCVPCRIEHPVLMRLANEQHLKITGIAYKDATEDSTRLLAQLGDPYSVIGVDRDGRLGLDFGVYGVPETYVIDREGIVRRRFVGPLSGEAVDRDLLPLLRQLQAQ